MNDRKQRLLAAVVIIAVIGVFALQGGVIKISRISLLTDLHGVSRKKDADQFIRLCTFILSHLCSNTLA